MIIVSLAVFLAISTEQPASCYRKPYFGATVVGAWAKYHIASSDLSEMTAVDRRLPDDSGSCVPELLYLSNRATQQPRNLISIATSKTPCSPLDC